ncbi:MAG: hypothetical protein KDA28_03435, partial [Phycisphaerales bacterium]|nr:hypothetical protein [Phycisphaerales bacterium]
LVVIAIIALLIGILLPALGSARRSAKTTVCGSRLQQMGLGLGLYLNEYDRTLPQKAGPLPGGGDAVIGALFAGKKGSLPFYGINEIGAEGRPLNQYLIDGDVPPDDSEQNFEIEACESPADIGAENTGVPIPGFERTDSMYELLGASYTLNDHAIDLNPAGDDISTLVPPGGGRMPIVTDTTKTWVIGSHPIYAHDNDEEREMYWYSKKDTRANLLFLDFHVKVGVKVPNEPGETENTTPDYTFLPTPDWEERYPW